MNYKEILSGLWIGNNNTYLNTGFHNKKKIEYSINCNLNNEDNIVDFLLNITKLIHKKLQQHQNILLYSINTQYAAVTVGAYLIQYGNISSRNVINIIYNKYTRAFKDKFFQNLLIEFEDNI